MRIVTGDRRRDGYVNTAAIKPDRNEGAPAVVAETPTEALAAILALDASGDYDRRVLTRQAELWKAAEKEQVEALVARPLHETVSRDRPDEVSLVSTYQAAVAVDPEMVEDDRESWFRNPGWSIRSSPARFRLLGSSVWLPTSPSPPGITSTLSRLRAGEGRS